MDAQGKGVKADRARRVPEGVIALGGAGLGTIMGC